MSLLKKIKLIPELLKRVEKLEEDSKNILFNWDSPLIEISNHSNNENPTFSYKGDSGFDLRAYINEENGEIENEKYFTIIKPLEHKLIDTGIKVRLIKNTELQVRPRSGNAFKLGLSVLNTPGTVDEKYTGYIKVNLINLSDKDIKIYSGDKIAQAVIMPVLNQGTFKFKNVDDITNEETENSRNSKGIGSSGIN